MWRAGPKWHWSSQNTRVFKTKWSHSCQPRQLPVRRDVLVQEGNYICHARHISQGDTPKISAHMIWTAMSAEQYHSPIGSWAFPHLPSGVPRHLLMLEIQKCGVHHFEGIAGADSRPLLRQLSSTHQSAAPRHTDLPWHRLADALPCWTEEFVYSPVHLALEILPRKMLMTP